jgi:hypothetical protein
MPDRRKPHQPDRPLTVHEDRGAPPGNVVAALAAMLLARAEARVLEGSETRKPPAGTPTGPAGSDVPQSRALVPGQARRRAGAPCTPAPLENES